MELRQLAYVIAAIDHGGFTRAAGALHVTQPSLSQGIRTLEGELGVDLFERIGRGVRLSGAGRAFEAPARRALAEAAAARSAAVEVLGLRAGMLRIVTLPTLVIEPLIPWVSRFRAAFPGIAVHVEETEASAVEDLVRSGRADIGLADVRTGNVGLNVELVIDQELVVICPPGTRVGASVSIRRLAAMPTVVTPVGTSTRGLLDSAFAEAGVEPRIAVEIDQREAILPLVMSGAGISFIPEPSAERARAEGAVVARVRPSLRRQVGLLRRAGQAGAVTGAFIEIVRGAP